MDLARHRGSSHVTVNDMATFLLQQYGMRIPPYLSKTQARVEEAQVRGSLGLGLLKYLKKNDTA